MWDQTVCMILNGQGLSKMKSGYIYFSNDELKQLKNILGKSKELKALDLLEKIYFYERNENDLVVLNQAKEKYCDDKEEIMIDEDALVSKTKNGSYVHAWVWVDNKIRRKRKKIEND